MATIRLRNFLVSPTAPAIPITVDDVVAQQAGSIELNLAQVLRVNAMAVPYRGPLLHRLVEREMSLLLSLFGTTPPGRPLLRHPAYESSSSHIRRFTTEAVAMGALTAVIKEQQHGLRDVAHFDALSAELKEIYPKTGTRPDLRFSGGGTIMAGESRGRNRKPPILANTTPDQRRRLQQLLTWSRQPGCDEVCMAWTWFQPDATVVDFFRFSDETSDAAAPAKAVEDLEAMLSPDEDDPAEALVGDVKSSYYRSRERERTAKQRTVRKTIEDREDQLIRTARKEHVRGMKDEWLGRWVDVPDLAGGTAARLLFAVTPQKRRSWRDKAGLSSMKRERRPGLEVSAQGRTLVAIDWARTAEPAVVEREIDEIIESEDA